MNMNRTEKNRIKTDRAWSKLYQRLEEDRLIPAKEDKKLRMFPLWKWGAVAAALLAALVYAGVRYFSEVKTPVLYSLVVQQNKETSTLVTTLEDGSIVYLGGETLLQYPEHFLPEKREVKLQGNALFDVVGSRSRPFLIETDLVRIEVLGTAFNVKSDELRPFELSVQRGRVKVTFKKNCQEMYVQAGETVTLRKERFHLSMNRDEAQFSCYLKHIRFKDEPLANILRVINLHSPEMQLKVTPSLEHRKLTVAFSGESPDVMAELIGMAMNLRCTREGNTFILSE